jgi:hypothetical protein
VLCMKTSCKPGKKRCYCCRTLPDNASCFWTQQQCWDSCPAAPLAATPAAAVASSILEELRRSITWEQFRTGCILETICDDLVSCICLENKPHKSMCETFCRVCVFIWTFGSRWFFFFDWARIWKKFLKLFGLESVTIAGLWIQICKINETECLVFLKAQGKNTFLNFIRRIRDLIQETLLYIFSLLYICIRNRFLLLFFSHPST